MVYETNSNNLIIENTSDGYIENVKLEGKTLVNLSDSMVTSLGGGGTREGKLITLPNNGYASFKCTDMQLQNKQLTVKFFSSQGKNNNLRMGIKYKKHDDTVEAVTAYELTDIQTFVVPNIEYKYIVIYIQNIGVDSITQEYEVLCLEGDHTQNPPNYFEGLKSVGEDIDKIIVSSLKNNGNLLYCESFSMISNGLTLTYNSFEQEYTLNGTCTTDNTCFFPYNMNTIHNISLQGKYSGRLVISNPNMANFNVRFYEKSYTRGVTLNNNSLTHTENYNNGDIVTLSIRVDSGQTFNNDKFKVCFNKGDTPIPYEPYKEHKKELLYKDVDGVWKKPILCEWNTIEKHDDGKWYYHKRSERVVLNGSEEWNKVSHTPNVRYRNVLRRLGASNTKNMVNDFTSLNNTQPSQGDNHLGINKDGNIVLGMDLSKATDLITFKSYLQANPITVVYQLAEEQIYECLPISVASYKGETTYRIESGVIAPTSSFELDYSLNNVVNRISDIKAYNGAMIDNLKIILTNLSSKVE